MRRLWGLLTASLFIVAGGAVVASPASAAVTVPATGSLSVPSINVVINQPIELTAQITSSDDTVPVNSGSVEFSVDGQSQGSANVSSGTATKSVTFTQLGSRNITATFSGNGIHTGVTFTPVFVNVVPVVSTLSYTLSTQHPRTHAWPGQACVPGDIWVGAGRIATQSTFTVSTSGAYTFTDQYLGGADGRIAILIGAYERNVDNCISEIDDSRAVTLDAGTTYTVLQAGYAGTAGSFSYRVEGPGSLTKASLLVPLSGVLTSSETTVVAGETVDLTTTVTSPGFTRFSGTIEFFNGADSLGTGTLDPLNGTARLTGVTLATGSHTLTGVYTGHSSVAAMTTPALTITVDRAASTTTVSALPNPVPAGDPLELHAVVGSPNGGANLSGTIEFFNGVDSLGTATVDASSKTATLPAVTLPVGAHEITAVYSGNTSTTGSSSLAPVMVSVVDATTTPLTPGQIDAVAPGGITVPAEANPGETIQVSVAGVADGEELTAWLHSAPVNLGGFKVVTGGQIEVTIPLSAPLGDHQLVVLHPNGTLAGWQPLRIVAAATSPGSGGTGSGLSATGGAVPVVAVSAGVVLAVVGVGVILWNRRRKTTHTAATPNTSPSA